MSIAKVQHYVPQFLLRNFCNGNGNQVWVYDKTQNRSFPTNTKNVAGEGRFYDFDFEGFPLSLEPWLSDLEGKSKTVIDAVLAADRIDVISVEQKQALAAFLAVQLTRTKTFREEWKSFPRMLREHLQRNGDVVAPGSQAEELLREAPDNDTKEQTARIVFQAPKTYSKYFLDKVWLLVATSMDHPFWTSDNPLTRQNLVERPHRGNLGLMSPGIEIYLPLSPTRALAMMCPGLVELVHDGAKTLRTNSDASSVDPVVVMSDALRNGALIPYIPANVQNFNSLQVFWSERYVFSSGNEFDLAESMLHDEPNLKHGPRSKSA
jgi:hypothetical protein